MFPLKKDVYNIAIAAVRRQKLHFCEQVVNPGNIETDILLYRCKLADINLQMEG